MQNFVPERSGARTSVRRRAFVFEDAGGVDELDRAGVQHHRNGTGARLMEVVSAAGIGFTVARTWPDGDRAKERRLKNSGSASRYCPMCREEREQRRAA